MKTKLTKFKDTRLDLILNEKEVSNILKGKMNKEIKNKMEGFLKELKSLESIKNEFLHGNLDWEQRSKIKSKFMSEFKFLSHPFVHNTFADIHNFLHGFIDEI